MIYYISDQHLIFFAGELVLLAVKLEGPLNIERVVAPIESKLSDAIANFQENSVLFSSKVLKKIY